MFLFCFCFFTLFSTPTGDDGLMKPRPGDKKALHYSKKETLRPWRIIYSIKTSRIWLFHQLFSSFITCHPLICLPSELTSAKTLHCTLQRWCRKDYSEPSCNKPVLLHLNFSLPPLFGSSWDLVKTLKVSTGRNPRRSFDLSSSAAGRSNPPHTAYKIIEPPCAEADPLRYKVSAVVMYWVR